jgi:molybdenum cofactor biosynthesis enzyme MoaA
MHFNVQKIMLKLLPHIRRNVDVEYNHDITTVKYTGEGPLLRVFTVVDQFSLEDYNRKYYSN